MFFSYVNFQRSQKYNCLLTRAFPRMFLKPFKKFAARVLSGLIPLDWALWL